MGPTTSENLSVSLDQVLLNKTLQAQESIAEEQSENKFPPSAVYHFVEDPRTPTTSVEPSTPVKKFSLLPRSTLLSQARLALITGDGKSPLGKNTSSPLVKRLGTNTAQSRFSSNERELASIGKSENLNSSVTKRMQSPAVRNSMSGISLLGQAKTQIGSAKKICKTPAKLLISHLKLDTSKISNCKYLLLIMI